MKKQPKLQTVECPDAIIVVRQDLKAAKEMCEETFGSGCYSNEDFFAVLTFVLQERVRQDQNRRC